MKKTTVTPYNQSATEAVQILNPADLDTLAVDNSTNEGEVNTPDNEPAAPAPTAEVAPEPAPAPVVVKSVTERVLEQTARLKKLNQTVTQITSLEAMQANLNRLTVDEADERSFAAIVIVDDMRRETKFTNPGLVGLNIKWLQETLAQKLAEKQADLLAVSLE